MMILSSPEQKYDQKVDGHWPMTAHDITYIGLMHNQYQWYLYFQSLLKDKFFFGKSNLWTHKIQEIIAKSDQILQKDYLEQMFWKTIQFRQKEDDINVIFRKLNLKKKNGWDHRQA